MKIYKVTLQYAYSKPVYVVCRSIDAVKGVVELHYPNTEIINIELISTWVIMQEGLK